MIKSFWKGAERSERTHINDSIFKELIKRGYSLEGNTRVWNIADSKLWYMAPDQAQAFLDLEQSEDYKKNVIQIETDLINQNIKEIMKKVGQEPLNIIDLGCGDGKKAVLVVKHFKGLKTRYCPIDISSYMVEKAIELFSKQGFGEVVKFQWNISDFENIENIANLLKQGEFKKNFILLLGNTLGNFEINELLYNIKSGMNKGDFLLIGNGLNNQNMEDILKAYNNKAIETFLIKTLIQVGLKEEELQYGVRFRNSRIETYFTIKKDVKITFLGRTISFYKGDQIIVAVSYKYDKRDLKGFLELYFDDVKIFASPNESYALAFCRVK
ncbi:MAG: L-histidine N(alpha)-methyltransferase [Nanoarchaeota archaeon]|nr:L-histidine N(alpha)-methyltransferase [Nanoarchaeota archaeon]